MIKNSYRLITKRNTITFYYSTIFFRKKIKKNVFLLYSFVRIIDDFVDKNPPDKKIFFIYKKEIKSYFIKNKKSKIKIINDICQLIKLINAKDIFFQYLNTQENEMRIKKYKSFKQFDQFIYGVAGTIGLLIAKILNLPKKTYQDAINLGKSLQIINNVRDLNEDFLNNKIYIPESWMKKYKLNQNNFLKKENTLKLKKLIKYILNKAFLLEKKSQKSYYLFNKKDLFPILIAKNLYFNIAKKILKNHILIFKKYKLKPNFLEVIFIIIKSFIETYKYA